MKYSLGSVARRLLSLHNNPTSNWPSYCSIFSSPFNNKLFVGGFSWSVDEKTLKDAFASYGDVTEGIFRLTIADKLCS
ncbi:Glycine-rich RNA-binding protein [Actinidia chinensis var. chinensis]|uniref:Glycine-rich RNA-binding protein n=1 Tax=Actinidia chinensis var. chinensis TaxID=1590841 RepID=A0A2R6QCT5_ACTCC|nr:Glycine-rich RNA-binding protein [Actinidia chinensis var. chinensis]